MPAVPLPASALLLMGAMGGFGVAARRKALQSGLNAPAYRMI
ncbi:VPLPA-CTERM sorting domain-containing protein [Psychrosphaera aquimarina]